MSNKMLIDATHPEETRVVVLRGNRVEEFDFEAADRQQLRGNIYLAKVTRVEPSLQAAFVDYGGNRHGFLAFSEIHPDYYQIPYADRQALLQEQAREEAEEAAEEAAAEQDAEDAAAEQSGEGAFPEESPEADDEQAPSVNAAEPAERNADAIAAERAGETDAMISEPAQAEPTEAERGRNDEPLGEQPETAETAEIAEVEADAHQGHAHEGHAHEDSDADSEEADDADMVESVGAEDALEEVPERRKPRPRQYKIQEVIKRRQVLLVQVVKEERGNKGAALTTYLSLAGRYSVLMPNTGRGGGISRKITNPTDRKRLKSIASELEVPEGMGVILRTAGANRTKAEVKRDFEYLLRLWENVRELTLRSSAPKLVYEEGSLIKRSIRDLYSREIDQVVVAGDDAYREAKDFMRMLMPSHARHVQQYRDDTPLFSRNGVEAQLDAMFSPQVTLKSGGYIVLNQTEALVSIDVNSGRSTREHSIEDTALNTNLEAAEEISRQLRLRDLAGLIVIDFIDMEEKRNNRSVERKLKDCLRADRARIQVGRISHFGLMEMSRQRIRTGVLESSTVSCPHCRGTGQVRSISSLSLQILRALEDHLLRHSGHHLFVRTRPEVALYVLNQKRRHLAQLEARFALTITVSGEAPETGAGFAVERGAPVEDREEREAVAMLDVAEAPEPREPEEDAAPEVEREEEAIGGDGGDRKRRRRRRRGNGEDRNEHYRAAEVDEIEPEAESEDEVEDLRGGEARPEADGEDGSPGSRRRRRGRRGGRRRGRGREGGEFAPGERPSRAVAAPNESDTAPQGSREAEFDDSGWPDESSPEVAEPVPAEQFVSSESGTPALADDIPTGDAHPEGVVASTDDDLRSGEPPTAEPETGVRETARPEAAVPEPIEAEIAPAAAPVLQPAPEPVVGAERPVSPPEPVDDDRPKRSGWWSRRSSFF